MYKAKQENGMKIFTISIHKLGSSSELIIIVLAKMKIRAYGLLSYPSCFHKAKLSKCVIF